MARHRKLSPERKAFINGLIEYFKLETAQDVSYLRSDFVFSMLIIE